MGRTDSFYNIILYEKVLLNTNSYNTHTHTHTLYTFLYNALYEKNVFARDK